MVFDDALSSPSSPKSSTASEARALPAMAARLSTSSVVPRADARYPMNPPAKVSPAPVGSLTVSRGMPGAAKKPSSRVISTPCSPRLITRSRGPICWMARAALTTFDSPASCRASSSLITRASIRRRTARSSSGVPSIQ